jgi:hypothetical protein
MIMIRKVALVALVCLALAGCGRRVNLTPKAGTAMPVKAEGAPVAATVDQLTTPSTQAKPKRSDEQLKSSEERRDDKFDLPPEG